MQIHNRRLRFEGTISVKGYDVKMVCRSARFDRALRF